jgi:hypothetical protein
MIVFVITESPVHGGPAPSALNAPGAVGAYPEVVPVLVLDRVVSSLNLVAADAAVAGTAKHNASGHYAGNDNDDQDDEDDSGSFNLCGSGGVHSTIESVRSSLVKKKNDDSDSWLARIGGTFGSPGVTPMRADGPGQRRPAE